MALTLHHDQTVGSAIPDGARLAGFHGELLGSEELFAVNLPVDDPFVVVAVPLPGGDGFKVVVVLEAWIEVLLPVELVDDEVDVFMFVLRHVLDEEGPGNFPALHQILVHAENVGAPLRFVGAEGTRRVQDTGVDEPAGSGLQLVGLGEFEDPVVALVPVGDAVVDLLPGGAGFESHEGVGEVVAHVVVLGREVVALGFALLADQSGLLGILGSDIDAGLAEAMNAEVNIGAFVSEVQPESAAEKAGLQAGDIITAINGRQLHSFQELRAKIASMGAGAEVELTVMRKGKKMNVDVVLDDATDTTVTAAQIHPALEGATLSNGADDAGNAGVVVSDIERGAPAARIGLQSDDVIIGVNRVRTSTVAEFRNALDEAKGVIALNVKRGNSTLYLVIRQ